MPSLAFLLSLLLAAAEPAEEPAEPGLAEVQEAAARIAGGTVEEDASRMARARRAHWAPVLRGQTQLKDDEMSRRGEFRNAPFNSDAVGEGQVFGVMLSWDLSQLVYAREESQLALTQAHLARLRREAAAEAAQLWVERRQRAALHAALSPGPRRAEACFAILELTAQLDALTGGLFGEALSREEAACAAEEKP